MRSYRETVTGITIRGAVAGYLGMLALLGVVTLVRAFARYGFRGEWLAAGWFAVAGSGLVLTAALLARYSRGEGDGYVDS